MGNVKLDAGIGILLRDKGIKIDQSSGSSWEQKFLVEPNGHVHAERVHNAIWNDLAEFFLKNPNNKNTLPGDVLVQTKDGVIKSYKNADKKVVGVYSDTYGFILKNEYEKNGYSVGLSGTVNVKIKDRVNIGDLLVSGKDGFAIKKKFWHKYNCVIGKSLVNKYNTDVERVLILII